LGFGCRELGSRTVGQSGSRVVESERGGRSGVGHKSVSPLSVDVATGQGGRGGCAKVENCGGLSVVMG